MRVGSCSEWQGVVVQLAEAAVELLAGEGPPNRPGLASILGFEGEDAPLQPVEAVRDGRRQHFAPEDYCTAMVAPSDDYVRQTPGHPLATMRPRWLRRAEIPRRSDW